MPFNIADYPEALAVPVRLSLNSQWMLHTPMAAMLMRMLAPRSFVELGVYRGDSYAAFCEAARAIAATSGGGLEAAAPQCLGIDTWAGDVHGGFYGPDVLAELRTFHDARYSAFSRLLQAAFDDALPQVAEGSVDLLHIDGLHTYDAVAHDFHVWRGKLSDRAVVLFHDTTEHLPGFGVWQFWRKSRRSFPVLTCLMAMGWGCWRVGANVPAAFLELLDRTQRAA